MVQVEQAAGPRSGLLERLMAVVRPEFRSEVFRLPRDSAVFSRGICVVEGCPVMVARPTLGLCEGHNERFKRREAQTSFQQWLIAEAQATAVRNAPPPACAIKGCERAGTRSRLCRRHFAMWEHRGRPEPLADWITRTPWTPSHRGGGVELPCRFPDGCPRWADGPTDQLCRTHEQMWRLRGRPDLEELRHIGDPRLRLGHLGPRMRLEFGFGLQTRHDTGTKPTVLQTLRDALWFVEVGQAVGHDSLLDLDDAWLKTLTTSTGTPAVVSKTTAVQFLRETRMALHLLSIDDPWADQYPRPVWDLQVLGVNNGSIRYLRFDGIVQPWLRELAKRWTRWRISQGLTTNTIASNLRGVTAFSQFLPESLAAAELDRARIEQWLAALAVQFADSTDRRGRVTALSTLLRDTHRHGWQPDLPASAMCYDDSPRRTPPAPRWIPEQVMAQIEAEHNLARFPSDDGRLLLRILINCGLRLGDARRLPVDCIVTDASGAPYLAWTNYKIHERPAFFPISDGLAEHIRTQQQRLTQRFAGGTPWLFPAVLANLDGSKPATPAWFHLQLKTWLAAVEVVHEGRPTRVTPHQFRHTLATRLINADVPQHVVQHLLDHMSPQMTAVYARLLDKTVRRHWERATTVDGEGCITAPAADHPLADAQWTRLSMNRAKITLPNGYCGAPLQTDCEYANPCLDCRFFLTTADFTDAHRKQRDETARLIADAKATGMHRIAEKNTKTLIKLEALISTLENLAPRQIVAGGDAEDLDAAV